jgi:hypothetical protein
MHHDMIASRSIETATTVSGSLNIFVPYTTVAIDIAAGASFLHGGIPIHLEAPVDRLIEWVHVRSVYWKGLRGVCRVGTVGDIIL